MIYHIGDVVKYVGNGRSWQKGKIHIIYSCDYCGRGTFEYSTNRGAWFNSDDFELVRRADEESFRELDISIFGE